MKPDPRSLAKIGMPLGVSPLGTIVVVIFRSEIGRVIGAYYQLNSIPGRS